MGAGFGVIRLYGEKTFGKKTDVRGGGGRGAGSKEKKSGGNVGRDIVLLVTSVKLVQSCWKGGNRHFQRANVYPRPGDCRGLGGGDVWGKVVHEIGNGRRSRL